MDALRQYTDLYTGHSAALRTGGAAIDTLREPALQAVKAFTREATPKAVYAEASLQTLFEPDYGINIRRVNYEPNLSASFHCGVPNISTLLGVTVNDVFRPTERLLSQLPAGVAVMSLAEAARHDDNAVTGYLNKLAADSDPATALNTMLLQDGTLIHVAKGVRLDKPVQLVDIFNAPTAIMASRRLLVVAEEGAALRLLLCDHTQRNDIDYLANEVIEIYCRRGSHIELYGIDEGSTRTHRICNIFARLDEDSHLTMCGAQISGGVGTTEMHIDLTGAHARADITGLTIADGNEVKTTNVHLRHLASDCTSRQIFKYALFGNSRGAFGGRILVADGAVRTDAAQTNRNLIATDGARMASAPQLEINCDDVKCSHGAATGQLDAEALFYMQSRGIPLQQARLMLTQAFMSDVVDAISYDLVRDRLRHLVELRLCGESATCASCNAADRSGNNDTL